MKIRLYFVTDKYFGSEMELSPRIPETRQEEEDSQVERICVSSSILGALSATCQCINLNQPTYIYYTDVNLNSQKVMQPTQKQVYDAPYTGEFWLLSKTKFNLLKMIEVQKFIPIVINNTQSNICEFKEVL